MIEDHVTSLELSKKLKELGVKQESEYHWKVFYNGQPPELSRLTPDRSNKFVNYSAFLASELEEMLPDYYATHHGEDGYRCFGGEKIHSEVADTEANARAKMLIYLIENGLMEVSK